MNVSTTPAVVAEIAREGDFNEFLREASEEELAQQTARIKTELDKNGEQIRTRYTDILKSRLSACYAALSLRFA